MHVSYANPGKQSILKARNSMAILRSSLIPKDSKRERKLRTCYYNNYTFEIKTVAKSCDFVEEKSNLMFAKCPAHHEFELFDLEYNKTG